MGEKIGIMIVIVLRMSIIHVTSCTARDRLGTHFIQYLGSRRVNQDENNKHDEAYCSEKKERLAAGPSIN